MTIRAVAIGSSAVDKTFDGTNPDDVKAVRPYIKGLIDWLELAQADKVKPDTDAVLTKYKYTLGTDYEIEYRERDVTAISDAFTDAQDDDILFK